MTSTTSQKFKGDEVISTFPDSESEGSQDFFDCFVYFKALNLYF